MLCYHYYCQTDRVNSKYMYCYSENSLSSTSFDVSVLYVLYACTTLPQESWVLSLIVSTSYGSDQLQLKSLI